MYMMSQSQVVNSGHDPLKPSSKLVPFPEKAGHTLAVILRVALLGTLAVSISLALYSSFATRQKDQTRWLIFTQPYYPIGPVSRPVRTGPAPPLEPTNISHILFGIGGSVHSWPDRSRFSALWWVPNLTRGYVWLDEAPRPDMPWPENSLPHRVSEDATRFRYSSSVSAVRIARIVLESFRLGIPDVRWFVMGDDDTVYFTENLVTVLAKYDHREMWYVGGNSESVEQDMMHGYNMAFGGGGFAISYALAARLATMLDGCLQRYYNFYGSDERIRACVSETGVTLTKEHGFHQMDIRGNPYGLLAAHPVAPLVSLHHIDSVEPIFPHLNQLDSVEALMSSYRVDPSRTLQQSFCYDRTRKWSIAISWGYGVQIYPSLVTANVLEVPLQTFKTWRSWSDGPFTFNTRGRGASRCDWPVVYFLDRVHEVERRGSVTSYNRSEAAGYGKDCKRVDYDGVMAIERIEVSSMKLDPQFWKKAPRRQCCEILDTESMKSGRMQIRIRKCRPQESITI